MALNLSSPLPNLLSLFTQTHTFVGTAGELIVAHHLKQSGYEVSTIGKRADLTVFNKRGDIIHVEVKTARYSSGKWQFSLTRKGHTDHRKADVIILLCACKAGYAVPFVLPVGAVYDIKHLQIETPNPLDYRGKYARFRQSLKSLSLEPALKELGLIHD